MRVAPGGVFGTIENFVRPILHFVRIFGYEKTRLFAFEIYRPLVSCKN
jgi:hypothetical protein